MKNTDIDRVQTLLTHNKWLLNSVKAIVATAPQSNQLSLADAFVLVVRGMLRRSKRIQEIFSVKEPSTRRQEPTDPKFICKLEKVLQDNMDWIKPMVEHYTPIDIPINENVSSSIDDFFATAEECSSCEHLH